MIDNEPKHFTNTPPKKVTCVPNQFKDKTVLITGATRGLGTHLAIELAKQGAHIIALGRTIGALEELDDQIKAGGGQSTLVPLELMQIENIDALGPTLFEKFDHIDLFFGNAAYLGGLAPITHFKTKEWEKLISTNLTANFALIRTLDPLLRRSEKASALFITDNQPDITGTAYWGPYSATKAALESLVKSYACELNETNVKACLINPGPMSTNLRRNAFPGEDQSNLQTPETVAQKIIKVLELESHENGETLKL